MADRFTWRPVRQSNAQSEGAVRRAQFGDGYTQSSADGINPSAVRWDMQFIGRKAEMKPLIEFLRSHVGKSFIWNDPMIGDAFFYCDSPTYLNNGADVYTVTGTFQQTFQP